MVFQGSAKHEGPVAGWHLIGLAREVQKEAKLVFSALQGSKEYFATLVTYLRVVIDSLENILMIDH